MSGLGIANCFRGWKAFHDKYVFVFFIIHAIGLTRKEAEGGSYVKSYYGN